MTDTSETAKRGSRLPRRARLAAIVATAAAMYAIFWLNFPTGSNRFDFSGMQDLPSRIAAGDAGAVEAAVRFASTTGPRCLPLTEEMQRGQNWQVRAAACRMLAALGEAGSAMMVSSCNDADWRVRAAAFDGLSQLAPLSPAATLRDMPLAQRERELLAWLEARDAQGGEPLLPRLCELYASAAYAEFGQPMVDRCLQCHVGAQPSSAAAGDRCASCHAEIHAAWNGSAHAQSLSHLQMNTVDELTREVRRIDFGTMRGINCTECHRPGSPEAPAVADASRCPFTFCANEPAGESCTRCHAGIHRQWLQWREGNQPRRADWPPGQVNAEYRGDRRTCTDCHMMPTGDGEAAVRDHHWAVRRDVEVLRRAVDVRVERAGGEVRLVLTNLTGHEFPAGTRRRAVLVYAGPAGVEQLPVVTTLSPVTVSPVPSQANAPLAPGEQRRIVVDVPPETESLAYRVVFRRNRFIEGGYELEICTGSVGAGR